MLELALSFIWLLVVSFSLGFALTRRKSLMTFGFGLAALIVLSVALDLVHVPLHWAFFLALSIFILAWSIYTKELDFSFDKPDIITIIVILLFATNTYVYWVGATSYPWLEDDDPWEYARDANYVSLNMTHSLPYNGEAVERGSRLEPFPPGYSILLGILHEMTPSLSDTVKFYNAALVGAGLIFAFCMVEWMTADRRLAVIAAFFLLSLPAFMSHFIWAQSLAIPLVFVAFYGFERSKESLEFIIPSAVASAAIAISHPAVAAIFCIFFAIYSLIRLYCYGRALFVMLVKIAVIAAALSCLFYLPTMLKFGFTNTISGIGLTSNLATLQNGTLKYIDDTSGGIIYPPEDFLFVQMQGKIDQQAGIGLVLSILAVAGAALALNEIRLGKKDPWLFFSVVLLLLGILGVEGNALPFRLFPHRFWVYLAIPVAILASYAYVRLEEKAGKFKKLLLCILVLSVLLTSIIPKLAVQNAQWPPGMLFSSLEELSGYASMKASLPPDTKVFPLCSDDRKVIGMDMFSEPYSPEYADFKASALNRTPAEVQEFMGAHGYSFMVLDGGCISSLGADKANGLANSYLASGLFDKAFSTQGMLFLKTR